MKINDIHLSCYLQDFRPTDTIILAYNTHFSSFVATVVILSWTPFAPMVLGLVASVIDVLDTFRTDGAHIGLDIASERRKVYSSMMSEFTEAPAGHGDPALQWIMGYFAKYLIHP